MSGAAPIPPSLSAMRKLYEAAVREGSPPAITLALCILTAALPFEVVDMDLERIDWNNSVVPVTTRVKRTRLVALSNAAKQLIQQVAGSAGGKGQVVTAGRGPRLQHRYVRLDRLYDRLGDVAPETLKLPEWNFHGIRAAVAIAILDHGGMPDDSYALLGRESPGRRVFSMRAQAEQAVVVAERWALILLSGTPDAQAGG